MLFMSFHRKRTLSAKKGENSFLTVMFARCFIYNLAPAKLAAHRENFFYSIKGRNLYKQLDIIRRIGQNICV